VLVLTALTELETHGSTILPRMLTAVLDLVVFFFVYNSCMLDLDPSIRLQRLVIVASNAPSICHNALSLHGA
jgi:hypothetical protein